MIRWIGSAPRMFSGLGLGVFAMGLLIGAASLTATGCGESVTEGTKIEPVDMAKKGEDSMKAYMQQKAEREHTKPKKN